MQLAVPPNGLHTRCCRCCRLAPSTIRNCRCCCAPQAKPRFCAQRSCVCVDCENEKSGLCRSLCRTLQRARPGDASDKLDLQWVEAAIYVARTEEPDTPAQAGAPGNSASA